MTDETIAAAASPVLIVEDNPAQLETLMEIIRNEQLQPLGCQSGQEALAIIQRQPVNVVVLDLRLPDMDGLDVLQQLKQHNPSLKVIINTAYASMDTAVEALHRDAFAYVQKMGDVEELLTHIHRAFHVYFEERAHMLQAANVELERVNRMKDEFLSTGSHELRTPLNVILGMVEVLREGVYGPLNPKQTHAIEKIESKGRQLLHIFQDMLDLSKIRLRRVPFSRKAVFLKEVCRVELARLDHRIQAKGLHVEFVFDDTVATIQADEIQVSRIVNHLCDNAIKFTPEGGRIGLEVHGDRARAQVRLSVWDTGIGIAPENLARIEQPFVQADGSLTRSYEGLGLGLAVVVRLTQLHDGTLTVESTPGQGSRFTVTLPWNP